MNIKRKLARKKQQKYQSCSTRGAKKDIAALLQQSVSLFEMQQFVQARSILENALSLAPNNAEANHLYALVLDKLQESVNAIKHIVKAIRLNPCQVAYHNNYGLMLKKAGDFHGAIKAFQRALEIKPNNPIAYYYTATVYFDMEDYNRAVVACENALAINKNYLNAMLLLAELYNFTKKDDSAIKLCQEVLDKKSDYPEAFHLLADMYAQRSMTKEAVATCKTLLKKYPSYSQGHHLLALIRRKTLKNVDEIEAMEKLYNETNRLFDKIQVGFALGKAYEDLGQYQKAFTWIEEANRLQRSIYSYDIKSDQAFFLNLKECFTEKILEEHSNAGVMDKSPIFIVGMPRSGTSLIEQILSSHPDVYGAGELTALSRIVSKYFNQSDRESYPRAIKNITDETIHKIGRDYIEYIRNISKNHRFIVDKMPHNFLRIGIIRIALPKAKVIHCERNLMATAWSIYKNNLKNIGHKYAYKLEEIGQYLLLYRDLMAFWNKTLPGFIYNIKYEALINNQHKQINDLLDYCGLEPAESCFSFHKSKTVISTMSFAQANKPIYTSSIELWANYEKELAPLKEILHQSLG